MGEKTLFKFQSGNVTKSEGWSEGSSKEMIKVFESKDINGNIDSLLLPRSSLREWVIFKKFNEMKENLYQCKWTNPMGLQLELDIVLLVYLG